MTKNLYVVLPDDTHRDLKVLAAEDSLSVKDWIIERVKDSVENRDDFSPEKWRKMIKTTFECINISEPDAAEAIIDQWQIEMKKRGIESKQ